MGCEAVKQDSGKNLSCNTKQGYASVVVTSLPISFPLIKMYNGSIFEFLRSRFLLPDQEKQLVEPFSQGCSPLFVDLSWYGV